MHTIQVKSNGVLRPIHAIDTALAALMIDRIHLFQSTSGYEYHNTIISLMRAGF